MTCSWSRTCQGSRKPQRNPSGACRNQRRRLWHLTVFSARWHRVSRTSSGVSTTSSDGSRGDSGVGRSAGFEDLGSEWGRKALRKRQYLLLLMFINTSEKSGMVCLCDSLVDLQMSLQNPQRKRKQKRGAIFLTDVNRRRFWAFTVQHWIKMCTRCFGVAPTCNRVLISRFLKWSALAAGIH